MLKLNQVEQACLGAMHKLRGLIFEKNSTLINFFTFIHDIFQKLAFLAFFYYLTKYFFY